MFSTMITIRIIFCCFVVYICKSANCPNNSYSKTHKHWIFPQCLSPVTAGAVGTEGVTCAGQAADGAVGEVIFLTLFTLQPSVPRHTVTLPRLTVTLVRVRHSFTAAVTHQLFRGNTHKRLLMNFWQAKRGNAKIIKYWYKTPTKSSHISALPNTLMVQDSVSQPFFFVLQNPTGYLVRLP